jgi:hypothetical protein
MLEPIFPYSFHQPTFLVGSDQIEAAGLLEEKNRELDSSENEVFDER